MTTLVFVGRRTVNGRYYHHSDELPPNVLLREEIDTLLDRRQLREYNSSDRRSLYRLFPALSGAKEAERFTKQELPELALPE